MLAPFAVYICQVNNAPLSNTLEQTYSVYLPFEGSRHLFDHAPHSLLSRQLIASCIFLPFRILERNCREYKTSNLECWKEKSDKWSFLSFLSRRNENFHRLFNDFNLLSTQLRFSRWRRIRRLKFGTRKGAAK